MRILSAIILFLCLSVKAATPTFDSFDTTWFKTNGWPTGGKITLNTNTLTGFIAIQLTASNYASVAYVNAAFLSSTNFTISVSNALYNLIQAHGVNPGMNIDTNAGKVNLSQDITNLHSWIITNFDAGIKLVEQHNINGHNETTRAYQDINSTSVTWVNNGNNGQLNLAAANSTGVNAELFPDNNVEMEVTANTSSGISCSDDADNQKFSVASQGSANISVKAHGEASYARISASFSDTITIDGDLSAYVASRTDLSFVRSTNIQILTMEGAFAEGHFDHVSNYTNTVPAGQHWLFRGTNITKIKGSTNNIQELELRSGGGVVFGDGSRQITAAISGWGSVSNLSLFTGGKIIVAGDNGGGVTNSDISISIATNSIVMTNAPFADAVPVATSSTDAKWTKTLANLTSVQATTITANDFQATGTGTATGTSVPVLGETQDGNRRFNGITGFTFDNNSSAKPAINYSGSPAATALFMTNSGTAGQIPYRGAFQNLAGWADPPAGSGGTVSNHNAFASGTYPIADNNGGQLTNSLITSDGFGTLNIRQDLVLGIGALNSIYLFGANDGDSKPTLFTTNQIYSAARISSLGMTNREVLNAPSLATDAAGHIIAGSAASGFLGNPNQFSISGTSSNIVNGAPFTNIVAWGSNGFASLTVRGVAGQNTNTFAVVDFAGNTNFIVTGGGQTRVVDLAGSVRRLVQVTADGTLEAVMNTNVVGSGGSQTPWLADEDASRKQLLNSTNIQLVVKEPLDNIISTNIISGYPSEEGVTGVMFEYQNQGGARVKAPILAGNGVFTSTVTTTNVAALGSVTTDTVNTKNFYLNTWRQFGDFDTTSDFCWRDENEANSLSARQCSDFLAGEWDMASYAFAIRQVIGIDGNNGGAGFIVRSTNYNNSAHTSTVYFDDNNVMYVTGSEGQRTIPVSVYNIMPMIVAAQTNVSTATSVVVQLPHEMPSANYSVTVTSTGFAIAGLQITARTTTTCSLGFTIGTGTIMITCVEQK